MHTEWIEELLRSNSHIIAAEVSIGMQVACISDLIEAGEDTAILEAWLLACRKNLRSLRLLRDDMLDKIEGAGGARSC